MPPDVRPLQAEAWLTVASRIARAGGWLIELPHRQVLWSQEACTMLEFPQGKSLALEEVLTLFTSASHERFVGAIAACAREATAFDLGLELHTLSGTPLHVRAMGQAVQDGNGNVDRIEGVFQDITGSDMRWHPQKGQIGAALDCIADAFVTLDRDWRITYLNKEAERLMQRSRNEVLGRVVWNEFESLAGSTLERECRRAMEHGCVLEFEEFYPALGLWFEIRVFPSEEGLVVFLRDVSALKRDRDSLRASEERFTRIARATTDAIWDWDLQTDTIWWSEGAHTLFGLPQGDMTSANLSWRSRIHGDDRQRVLNTMHAAIDSGVDNWTDEYRFLRADGSYAYVLDRGYVIRDDSGRALRMVGGMSDVSARKAAETELANSNRALRMVSACNSLLLRATDEQQLLQETCRLAVEIGGYRMAWVGYANDDAKRSITPVAQAGRLIDPHYLDNLHISWAEDRPEGQGLGLSLIHI